jgi:hypothetical protein
VAAETLPGLAYMPIKTPQNEAKEHFFIAIAYLAYLWV